MDLTFLIAGLACASAVVVSAGVFIRDRPSVPNVSFAAGLLVLAVEALVGAFANQSALELHRAEMVFWSEWRQLLMGMAPFPWLLFALTYSRGNYLYFLKRWGFLLGGLLVVPLLCGTILFRGQVVGSTLGDGTKGAFVQYGWPGTLLHLVMLGGAVLVLVNLERTFRASVGTMRWRIKFMILGVGLLFAARIYSSSQAVLFGGATVSTVQVDAGALLLASLLAGRSLLRAGMLGVDVYPSRSLIQSSVTILFAGLYLTAVGLVGRVVRAYGGEGAFPVQAVVVLGFVGLLTVFLMSDRLKQRLTRWISRNFQRPEYDYRQVWLTFSERTVSLTDEEQLCRSVAKWVSETFNALSVTIWLVDEGRSQLRFGASTAFGAEEGSRLVAEDAGHGDLIQMIRDLQHPVDLEETAAPWAGFLRRLNPALFPEGGRRICLGLATTADVQGVVVVGDRVGGAPFSLEDQDLLKCVGDQVAGLLRNVELSAKLLQAREMEAFQSMSTFFVHDLKNTASTLSLMLKNLPEHFHDPSFRADALRAIGKTVDRINELIGRLSLLRQKLEMRLVESDMNAVVLGVLDGLAAHALPVRPEFGVLPKVRLDPDQFQKVMTNLILNAKDALPGEGGWIQVKTEVRGRFAMVSVSDNGCGMSPEFLSRSLFRPFQTTKKKGIGIGMYHTKLIVEAHRGQIDVESAPGKGTTFRLLIPLSS